MKIKKLLPITLAMLLCTTGVYAAGGADAQSSDTAVYTLNLADYLRIATTTEPTASDVSYGTEYSSATIDTAMTGVFKVISNNRTQDFYLIGTCQTADGETKCLYGADGDCKNMKMVFTKTDVPPAATAVTNITGGSATTAENPDAIGFNLAITPAREDGPDEDLDAVWDSDKVKYTMNNGIETFTCTVSGSNDTNTFSTHDTDGQYQATLTMTETAL